MTSSNTSRPATRHHIDTLIVGQGLAGSLLAWVLSQHYHQQIMVIDPNKDNASRMAAGIINPVTGQRLVLQANIEQFISAARQLYADISDKLHCRIWHDRPMLRLFRNSTEKQSWQKRSHTLQYQDYIDGHTIPSDFGEGFRQHQTAYINTATLLDGIAEWLTQQRALLPEALNYSDIHVHDDAVRYRDISAQRVIFCEGHQLLNNPWFGALPLQPVKGEILDVTIPGLEQEAIVNRGAWLLPLGNDCYRFGATYAPGQTDSNTSTAAREQLTQQLTDMIGDHYTFNVKHQTAGIRPATRDYQPLLGFHHKHNRLGVFNGFGSRGGLLMPWYAQHLASVMLEDESLQADVDIARFSDLQQDVTG